MCGLDVSDSKWGPVAGPCDFSGSVKDAEFLA